MLWWRLILFLICLGLLSFTLSTWLALALLSLAAVVWGLNLVLIFWQMLTWEPPRQR